MKKITVIIVLVQLLVLSVISVKVYKNYQIRKVLGTTSVAPLNKEFFANSTDSEFKYYTLLQPSTTPTDTLFWDNTLAYYTFNKDGLNERFDYEVAKPDGVVRIVTLGDSFTFGHYIDTKNNWTEQLEDLLNKKNICSSHIKGFEIINLGMAGFDIPYIVKRYKDIGLKYNPDLIVWFESGNGFVRNIEKMNPLIIACEEQNKVATNSGISRTVELNKCWSNAQDQMLKDIGIENIQRDLETWVSKFLDNIRGNSPVLFSTFSSTQSDNKKIFFSRSNTDKSVFVMDEISDIYSKNGFFPDGHPNFTGHTSIANDMYKYLNNNSQILPNCN